MSASAQSRGGEPDVLRAQWSAPANVCALVTSRAGGVSLGDYAGLNLADHVGDDEAAVMRNRAELARRLRLPSAPYWLRQVHGTTVAVHPGPGREPVVAPTADAAVSREPGAVLAVLTADCLPVAFAACDGSVVGIAHAGWRGLAAGVLGATVTAMGVGAAGLVAWLGPSIESAAFEVGEEVREVFVRTNPAAGAYFAANSRGRWQADLAGLATLELVSLGVGRVHPCGLGTYADAARWYSYRREPRCGRMATLVWFEPPLSQAR